ncbi:MAG: hypothetical protein ACOCUT_00790 [bacterium]
MSGGEWDYFHRRFYFEMEDFCRDIKDRFPELSETLLKKTEVIYGIHIDYDVSGDTMIEFDKDFEQEAIKKLNSQ